MPTLAFGDSFYLKAPSCPFCDQPRMELAYEGQPAQYFYVQCANCGACGPRATNANQALASYQLRPAQQKRRGFMCLVDWELHMEGDAHPVKVYLDEATLRQGRECIDQCGMAEVDVVLVHKTPGQSQQSPKPRKRPYKQRIKNA